jgi:ABC-type multidrug transport system fused ATPase/permease subunit
MGLYKPDKGELLVDDKKIKSINEIKSWQKKISYVPQSIFLFNGSIKNNVSFEFNENLIDVKKVSQSLMSSQLEKFANPEEKMNYIINEGGGNVSIGEKQRIGIARALYKNPELIILDEPTSSLDDNTAKNLIKFLGEFRKKRTLIIISHDIKSLQFCNKIYEIKQSEKGKNKIFLKDSFN